MMLIENVQVQLIDTPPLNKEHIEPGLLELIRSADLLLILLDLQGSPLQELEDTLEILKENRIDVWCRKDQPPPESGHKVFQPLIIVNKHDDESWDEEFQVLSELYEKECSFLPVSAKTSRNFQQFKQAIYQELGIIRIYSKRPGREPNLESPFVMKRGGTVEEFASRVHKDFLKTLKSARVWGSAAFPGQQVGRDHVLQEGDVVELTV
jgi:ribosome-interacting GTPase 1